MYALPPTTLLNKQIPKKAIFEKFPLSSAQRQRIDADIARIDIVAQLAPHTLPAVAKGTEIESIYVVQVRLKTNTYSKESIALLARLIPQRMLFVLHFEGEVQLALVHEGLHSSNWLVQDEVQIPLEGLDFDGVWAHLVVYVSDIALDHEQTLEQQIQSKQRKERLLREIAQLKAKMGKEKQMNKKMALWSDIKRLQRQIDNPQ